MKKYILLLSIWGISIFTYAQVGINTTNPQGIFHIDSNANNNVTGVPTSAQTKDDVIFTPDGNLGIGEIKNGVKVNLNSGGTNGNPISAFALQDGNEAATKALTSDANGYATWKYAKPQGAVIGSFASSTGVAICMDANASGTTPDGLSYKSRSAMGFVRTSGQITLSPGRWWIKMSLYLSTTQNEKAGEQVWTRTTLGDDSSGEFKSNDLDASYTLASNNVWKQGGAVITGSFIVTNKSSSDKKYYLMMGWMDGMIPNTQGKTVFKTGNSNNAENTFIAYRILE